ncbi:TRAP transporter small permease [Parendozoicomonas haliclonae]|uniref:TRAP transporter small permease protein n=1 Tax=Parendozoicomonas haliclonae TaxID=1960125 RepID=A0A1X7AGB4_9GAMM|nr:TRAP transporter small permease [Parendozoicomonas haliclonae]SMA39582.1 Sialic acid TRAP transporter permease protein SiaT [Parendozoicomonas haliclonae]
MDQNSPNSPEAAPKKRVGMPAFELGIAGLALSAIVIITVWGVFTRFVLNDPAPWIEEASLALFIWFSMLGASALMKDDEHVRIDFLIKKFPPSVRFVLDQIVRNLIIIASLGFMAYWGFKLIPMSTFRLTPTLQIPYSYIHSAVAISSVLMIIHCIFNIYNAISEKK